MPLPIHMIALHRGDRRRLEQLVRTRTTAHRVVERAHSWHQTASRLALQAVDGSRLCGQAPERQMRRLAVTSVEQLIGAHDLHRPAQRTANAVCLDRHRQANPEEGR